MKNQKGFTLVELLIYTSILTVTVGMLVGVLTNTLRIKSREGSNAEVAQQLGFAVSTIQSLVNDSSLIESVYQTDNEGTACTTATNYCTLKLRFSSDSLDPTWVVGRSTGVYVKRNDGGSEDPLTDSSVTVDKVRFTKYAFSGGHDSVGIEVGLTYDTDNPQFQISRSIISTYGRASAATFDDDLVPGGSTYDVGQSGSKWRNGWFSGDVRVVGALGVGTSTAPVDTLQVVGDARVGTGTTGCLKDADGTTIAGSCSSDKRLKTNIEPLDSILERYARLNPVSFNWKYQEYPDLQLGSETQYGLVAQEVETLFPELVKEDEDGFKRVEFSYLPIYNIQAVKEQQAQIALLADKIEGLTGEEVNLENLNDTDGGNTQNTTKDLVVAGLLGGLLSAGLTLLLLKRKQ